MHTFAQKPKASQPITPTKITIPGRTHVGKNREGSLILGLQDAVDDQALQRLARCGTADPDSSSVSNTVTMPGYDFSQILVHAGPGNNVIQTKLKVNAPGDIYEQEAERVAEQVMRSPDPPLQRTCTCGGTCPKCQKDQISQGHEHLQTKQVSANDAGNSVVPSFNDVLPSSGQPLDTGTRTYFESRMGHDFSKVRVHQESDAAALAQSLNARAFTYKNNIVFGNGEYRPSAREGRRLLAHELVHVQQQRAGSRLIQRQDIEVVGEHTTGSLKQNQRRAAKSCPINCGTNNLGTLHAMALFYHANRQRIVAAGSASATGIGIALNFIKSGTTLPASNPCHCNNHKIIQVLQNSHPIGTRGKSYVDNAGRSTPFYGDVYRSGSGRHQVFAGYPDAGRHITTTHSIYDRPQRTTSGRSGQNISWNAEACLACVKTGKKDKVLGCVTYGFRRNWNAAHHRHDPVQGISPACRRSPSAHFVNTLTNDPTTSSYQFES
jgi:hypothetical protein